MTKNSLTQNVNKAEVEESYSNAQLWPPIRIAWKDLQHPKTQAVPQVN